MSEGRILKEYGLISSRLNELCKKYEVVPIYNYGFYFMNRRNRKVYEVSLEPGDPAVPIMIEKAPYKYTRKSNVPVYYLRPDNANKVVKVRGDILFLNTFYGPLTSLDDVNYKIDYTDLKSSEIEYKIFDFERIDDDTLRINTEIFKKVYINAKYSSDIYISNKGVCYNYQKNKFQAYSFDNKMYTMVYISSNEYDDNSNTLSDSFRVYRLVYNVWTNQNPWLPTEMQVDHIDGYKYHNNIENLRAIDNKTNFRASFGDQNLRYSAYSVKEINTLCKYIQDAIYSPREIAVLMNKPYKSIAHTIKDIRNGKEWTDVASNYDFSKYEQTDHSRGERITPELVTNICELAMEHIPSKEIAKKLNRNPAIINQTLRGEHYPEIVQKYDLSFIPHVKQLTDEQVVGICERVMNGESVQSIATDFNYTEDKPIRNIIRRKDHADIGKNYHFELLYPDRAYVHPYEPNAQ